MLLIAIACPRAPRSSSICYFPRTGNLIHIFRAAVERLPAAWRREPCGMRTSQTGTPQDKSIRLALAPSIRGDGENEDLIERLLFLAASGE
jgi:hypothetical protein